MPVDDALWVKLPESQVNDLIDEGLGLECRPNGRVFREWLSVPIIDEGIWMELLNDSIDFVRP